MSLTKVTYSMISGAAFNVLDYGAVADGVVSPSSGTDNGPAFRAALLAAAQAGGGTIVIPHGTYRVTTTVIIPNNVIIQANNSVIVGPSIGSATDLFQSGYYNGSAIVTNIGTSAESHQVSFSIYDLTIYYCGKAFNFYDVLEGSIFERISFNDCTYAMYLDRCFYASFRDIVSRGDADGATNAAIYLNNVNNVQNFCSVFVNGRVLGFQLSGGSNALKLFNCSAEGCQTGVYITNETGPIAFDTCYFENIYTGAAIGVNIDSQYDKEQISFTNCFFNYCTTAIKTPKDNNTRSRLIIDATNRFYQCTTNIDSAPTSIYPSIYHQNKIDFVMNAIDGGAATLPSTITVDKGDIVNVDLMLYDNSSTTPIARTKVHGDSLIPWNVEGNGGSVAAGANSTPFCTFGAYLTDGVYVDTKIKYDKHTALLVYRYTIVDYSTTTELYGFVFGDTVVPMDSTGTTVTLSNAGGYVRLAFQSFTSPINIRGFVRFM